METDNDENAFAELEALVDLMPTQKETANINQINTVNIDDDKEITVSNMQWRKKPAIQQYKWGIGNNRKHLTKWIPKYNQKPFDHDEHSERNYNNNLKLKNQENRHFLDEKINMWKKTKMQIPLARAWRDRNPAFKSPRQLRNKYYYGDYFLYADPIKRSDAFIKNKLWKHTPSRSMLNRYQVEPIQYKDYLAGIKTKMHQQYYYVPKQVEPASAKHLKILDRQIQTFNSERYDNFNRKTKLIRASNSIKKGFLNPKRKKYDYQNKHFDEIVDRLNETYEDKYKRLKNNSEIYLTTKNSKYFKDHLSFEKIKKEPITIDDTCADNILNELNL